MKKSLSQIISGLTIFGFFAFAGIVFAATVLTTDSGDTLNTFRTNVNTSLGNLNSDKLDTASTTDDLTEGSTNLYSTEDTFSGFLAGTTTDALSEGASNLYYTDTRVDDRINASSTIWNNNTESSLQTFLTDVTDVFTNNDGALADDDLSDDKLNALNETSLADPGADQIVFWDDSDTQFEFISTLTGLSITTNTLSVDTVDFSDGTNATAGTGISFSGDAIDADLGTAIDTSEITDGTILEGDLNLDDSPSDEDILTYDSTGTNFVWETILDMVNKVTGAVDWGGITSFEIPNGSAPTTDTAGEISLDTTDEQLLVADSGGTARVIQTEQRIWGVTVASTSPAFIDSATLPVPTQLDGYTISRIQCHVVSGTSKVIAVEDASANSSEDITCATTNTTDDGTITNATYTASELPFIDFGATTGAVDYVSISVFGHYTRE